MTKDRILAEIRRLAAESAGVPPGQEKFSATTGIGKAEWYGKHWARWSDAIAEAGLAPNRFTGATPEDILLGRLASFVAELGHFPVAAQMRMKARSDASFPDDSTFRARFGGKKLLAARLQTFCVEHDQEDVAALCKAVAQGHATRQQAADAAREEVPVGYVYLVQHGARREFKIGRTNNPLRREGEVSVELPQRLEPRHVIQTDDPSGVEAYWHRRFAKKLLKNEWFALTPQDVRAFKRWRKIY